MDTLYNDIKAHDYNKLFRERIANAKLFTSQITQ